MATVVIIHAPEDALPARALAEKLRLAKLTVVIEKPAGQELRAAIKTAPVTIALWSPRSATQAELVEDAAFARGKTTLIHACMQSAPAPPQFRSDQAVNLTGWRGEDDFPAWRELAKLVTDKAGMSPMPAPAPRTAPTSVFFQPGRPAGAPAAAGHAQAQPAQRQASTQVREPPPHLYQAAPRPSPQPQHTQSRRAPRPMPAPAPPVEPERRSGGSGALIGAIAFVVIAAGGGGYYFWRQSQSAQTTSAAWADVDQSNVEDLRAFLAANPGALRDEAQSALVALEERSFEAASDADTIDALEDFLNAFPESEHTLTVQGRIAELRTLAPTIEAEPQPVEHAIDPDLVPPGSAPETSGGPAPITPPATPAPTAPDPGLPVN